MSALKQVKRLIMLGSCLKFDHGGTRVGQVLKDLDPKELAFSTKYPGAILSGLLWTYTAAPCRMKNQKDRAFAMAPAMDRVAEAADAPEAYECCLSAACTAFQARQKSTCPWTVSMARVVAHASQITCISRSVFFAPCWTINILPLHARPCQCRVSSNISFALA